MNASKRFWSKVQIGKPNECWIFTGTPKSPQAQFRANGRTYTAARFVFADRGVIVPPYLYACHACDNPKCVNPSHLWLGTQRDNIRDMHAKNRAYNGHDKITYCPSGHEYTKANTRVYLNKRVCRQCDRDRNRNNPARALASRRRSLNASQRRS